VDFDLDKALAPFAASKPLACRVTRRIAEDKLLRSAVEYLVATEADYVPRIAPALDALARMYAAQGKSMDDALEAVLEYTHLYMRHQVSFLAKGEYSNTDFDEVYREVYDNEELMLGTYLPGLYLTQLYWPVHFRVLSLYENELLAAAERDKPPRRVLEFGVGHGMTLLAAKRRFPQAGGLAVDVSRHSLRFAESLLRTAGVELSGLEFRKADVVTAEFEAREACELGTMGEILEHVKAPERALQNFRTLLVPSAYAFITTVIDSNAIDHIYQFSSQTEIDDMITRAGFTLQRSELIRPAELRLSGEPGNDPTRYYVCVARAS
jgi:2-polyprenyl-3-methyl-5-hydroxy-6-metoxy-1,4-benzoquinol methylase